MLDIVITHLLESPLQPMMVPCQLVGSKVMLWHPLPTRGGSWLCLWAIKKLGVKSSHSLFILIFNVFFFSNFVEIHFKLI